MISWWEALAQTQKAMSLLGGSQSVSEDGSEEEEAEKDESESK